MSMTGSGLTASLAKLLLCYYVDHHFACLAVSFIPSLDHGRREVCQTR